MLDAIAAAGGLTDTADPGGVNLARFIDRRRAAPKVPVVGEVVVSAPGVTADGPGEPQHRRRGGTRRPFRVWVPRWPRRIIAWREANGGFQSVEDLRGVTGIGERTFAELEPLVTV